MGEPQIPSTEREPGTSDADNRRWHSLWLGFTMGICLTVLFRVNSVNGPLHDEVPTQAARFSSEARKPAAKRQVAKKKKEKQVLRRTSYPGRAN